MELLVEDPGIRARMGKKAFEHVRDKFTIDETMKKLLILYGFSLDK